MRTALQVIGAVFLVVCGLPVFVGTVHTEFTEYKRKRNQKEK